VYFCGQKNFLYRRSKRRSYKKEEKQDVEFKYDEENGRIDLNTQVRNEDITLSIT